MYFLIVLGMIQRLEKLKKNAFASCCLFGEDNKNAISGKLVYYIIVLYKSLGNSKRHNKGNFT